MSESVNGGSPMMTFFGEFPKDYNQSEEGDTEIGGLKTLEIGNSSLLANIVMNLSSRLQ